MFYFWFERSPLRKAPRIECQTHTTPMHVQVGLGLFAGMSISYREILTTGIGLTSQKQHITLFPDLFQEGKRINKGVKLNWEAWLIKYLKVNKKTFSKRKTFQTWELLSSPYHNFSRTDQSAQSLNEDLYRRPHSMLKLERFTRRKSSDTAV